MLLALTAAGILAAAAAAPSPGRPSPLVQLRARPAQGSPDLRIRPWGEAPAGTLVASAAPRARRDDPSAPCIGDVCQPRVSVPGYEAKYDKIGRTELALSYLDRVRLEPFATIAWTLLVTGLRLDYYPPAFDGASAAPGGWGTVFVRVRFRVDADNVPVVPKRPRDEAPPARGSS